MNRDVVCRVSSLLVAFVLATVAMSATAAGYFTQAGKICDATGQELELRGVNHFGFNATILQPQFLWAMGWKEQIAQIKSLGFNAIRVPFVPDTLYNATPVDQLSYVDPDRNPELLFTVESYHVSMRSHGKTSLCEATVKVRVGDQVHHTVAEGDGPVDALDGALRSALAKSFPKVKQLTLTDYKVRILDGVAGTAAKTRVLIQSTDGKREWGTVGVSENIITASLQALVDSMEYALLKK